MNLRHKIAAASLLALFVLPVAVSAQTVTASQLLAQIQSLTAKVHSLQQQLVVTQGGSAAGSPGVVTPPVVTPPVVTPPVVTPPPVITTPPVVTTPPVITTPPTSGIPPVSTPPTVSWCYTFGGNLQIGNTGPSVTALQTALVKDGESVSVTGLFDQKTASAVTGFQQKYASQILVPNGLRSGTGYAGKSTRVTLNSLFGCSNNAAAVTGLSAGQSPSRTGEMIFVSKNPALGTVSVVPGQTNVKVGSYVFSLASSLASEGASVNSLSITANVGYFQNLHVMVNGAPFGVTQGTVAQGGTYTFSGTPFTVPLGGKAIVDVYTDILGSASGSATAATTESGCSAVGLTSYAAIKCIAPVQGQGIILSSSAPTLSVSADATQPPASYLVAGSVQNTLAIFRFTETSNLENIKITDLKVTDITSSTPPSFSNLTLYNGATMLGTAGSATPVPGGFTYTFHLVNPIIVPQANSVSITLKGDVGPAGMDSLGSIHVFQVAQSGDVTALGATSNKPATVTINNANGNPMTVVASTLTATAAGLGAVTGRMKSFADRLGTLSLTANTAGWAATNKITVTFQGSALAAGGATFLNTVQLLDANNISVVIADGATVSVNPTAGTVTWTFGAGSGGFMINPGSTYTFTLQANSTVIPAEQNVAESLSASIMNASDIQYSVNGTTGLGLPASSVPLTINSVTYAVGM